MEPHRLAPGEARRIAITAQRLTAERQLDVVGLVHDLTVLQVDPIAAIAPSADLVAWMRFPQTMALRMRGPRLGGRA